jgi:hypothetical protein
MRDSLLFPVADGCVGLFLSGRGQGATDRERLLRLTESTPGRVLTLDFTGVEAMTRLYADELLGRFLSAYAAGDVSAAGIRLTGLTEEASDAVTVALEQRRQCVLDADQNRLLGHTAALDETYEIAQDLGVFAAADIAAELRITQGAANNRLTRLVQAGALTRARTSPAQGGKEFVYRVLPSSVLCRK